MRISDWSSDVCSSYLGDGRQRKPVFSRPAAAPLCAETRQRRVFGRGRDRQARQQLRQSDRARGGRTMTGVSAPARRTLDRQGVVEGKRESVRVDLGVSRIFQNKNNTQTICS